VIGARGDLRAFWSNGLVGTVTTLALVLLFWPVLGSLFERAGKLSQPAASRLEAP
jgi:putative tricarboxylic transport membrane protein